jgi:hypothetical protein
MMNKSLIARGGSSDDGVRVLVYRKTKSKKNKRSRGTKILERGVRRLTAADGTFYGSYLKRHRRSNSKRRDGWLRDMDRNLIRADNKARKKLKIRRILGI